MLLQGDMGDVVDDDALPGRVVEECTFILEHYRKAIDELETQFMQEANQGQAKLNELQVVQGGKIREIEEVKTLYELKLAEPEFTPLRPARHTLARTKLAEQGIIALPLYMLLDFTPDIDCESEEAGRIEWMLEDAGLLDALVVAPSQAAQADALLASEGLSDCRLDIDGIQDLLKNRRPGAAQHEEHYRDGR